MPTTLKRIITAGRNIYRRKKTVSRNYGGIPWNINKTNYPASADIFFRKLQNIAIQIGSNLADKVADDIKTIKTRKYVDKREIAGVLNRYFSQVNAIVIQDAINITRDLYISARNGVENEAGVKIMWTAADDALLHKIQVEIFSDINMSLGKIFNTAREKFLDFITNTDINRNDIRDFINGIINLTQFRATMIIRNEMTAYYNEIKRQYFSLIEAAGMDIKYIWSNPMDDRTTPICRAIVNRTKNGVSMNELIQIVREESQRYIPTWWKPERPLSAHFGCRSTLVAVSSKRKKI